MRAITIIEFEKYLADTCIFSIVIGKLRHKQKLSPVVLFLIDKNLKVGFSSAILLLSFAIGQWVEDSRELLLDVQEVI